MRGLEGFQHQGGSVNAVGELFVVWKLAVGGPHEGHTIGADEIETGHGFPECGIMAGERGDMGVGGFDGVGPVGFGGVLENPFDGASIGGGSDRETDDGNVFQEKE